MFFKIIFYYSNKSFEIDARDLRALRLSQHNNPESESQKRHKQNTRLKWIYEKQDVLYNIGIDEEIENVKCIIYIFMYQPWEGWVATVNIQRVDSALAAPSFFRSLLLYIDQFQQL